MRNKQKIINLYNDSSVQSIKHVISIGSEEDLNQFWHYFYSEVVNDYKLLYSFISLMYAFTSKLFEANKNLFFELIIEQNEDCFYFTLWNADISKAMTLFLDQRNKECEYKIDKKRITVKILKELLLVHNETYDDQQKHRRKQLVTALTDDKPIVKLPYDFLEEEDRQEILKSCDDMSDIMYRAKNIGLKSDVTIRLRSCLSMFSLSLLPYSQVTQVSNIITEFSVLLNNHQVVFEQMSSSEVEMIEGFISNIERWTETLFVIGGADLHFMDSSLKADLGMIKMLIEPQEEKEFELDDIFNF